MKMAKLEKGDGELKYSTISPGTQFMYDLNKCLEEYIEKKIEEDEDWKHLDIEFSSS